MQFRGLAHRGPHPKERAASRGGTPGTAGGERRVASRGTSSDIAEGCAPPARIGAYCFTHTYYCGMHPGSPCERGIGNRRLSSSMTDTGRDGHLDPSRPSFPTSKLETRYIFSFRTFYSNELALLKNPETRFNITNPNQTTPRNPIYLNNTLIYLSNQANVPER